MENVFNKYASKKITHQGNYHGSPDILMSLEDFNKYINSSDNLHKESKAELDVPKTKEQVVSKLADLKRQLKFFEDEYEKTKKDKWTQKLHDLRGGIKMLRWVLGYK